MKRYLNVTREVKRLYKKLSKNKYVTSSNDALVPLADMVNI